MTVPEIIKKRIFQSILISLLIHLGFLIWSFFVKLVPYSGLVNKPDKTLHIKMAKEEKLGGRETTQSSDNRTSEKSLHPEDPSTQAALETQPESPEVVRDKIAAAVPNHNEALVPAAPQKNFYKPQKNDVMVTKKVRRATRKNLVDVGEIPQADFASGSPVIVSGEDISQNFLDKGYLAVKAGPSSPMQVANGPDQFQVMQKSSAGLSRKLKAADLGTTLIYELTKYQDPKSGQKYFKLVVKVKDATANFPVVPKEIIFLVDASESIGEVRLKQFQEGLNYSLNHLNPDDRFNILIFKDKTIPFSPQSLKPEPDNIKKAIQFLEDLKSGSRTDVYDALQTSMDFQNSFEPSYRVLLSDGFPTKGVTNSRQVINEISDMNNGKFSVFSFGGGVNISQYMLDFLAYKNRGWSQTVDREYLIGKEFAKLSDRIKDPLLLHLRYRINGLNEKEVFPQILPDFFKGSEFVIYGTFKDENKFVVQVLGNALGETKEFIVNAALDDAAAGNKDIARQWAFHKVYHLISELKFNEDNQALIKEIDDLCAKFEIVTPYSRNFRESHKSKKAPAVKDAPKPEPAPSK